MDKTKFVLKNFEFLFKYVWEYKKKYFLYILMSLIFSSIYSYYIIQSPGLLIRIIEDNAYNSGEFLYFFIIMITSTVIVSWSKLKYTPIAYKIRYDLLSKIMSKTLNISYEDYEKPEIKSKTWTAYRAVSSIDGVQSFYNNIGLLTESLGSLLVCILILSRLSSFISTVVVIWISTFCVIYIKGFTKKQIWLKRNNYLFHEQWYLRDLLTDFSYSKELRVYNLKKWLRNKVKISDQRVLQANNIGENIVLKVNYIDSIFQFFRDILIFWVLISTYFSGDLSLSEFSIYSVVIIQLNQNLTKTAECLKQILSKQENYKEMINYINLEEEEEEKEEKLTLNVFDSIIFENVSYCYPETKNFILENVSFQVNSGDKIAIVGLNGNGKTTLLKLAMGLLTPTKGKIYINGKNTEQINKKVLYEFFSPVFQDITIFPFSIKENLTLGHDFKEKKLKKAIETVGLTNKVGNDLNTSVTKYFDKNGHVFSGGELQRIMLGRAISFGRPIMILDEPTSAMDASAENIFYEDINNYFREKTIFFVTHRLASTKFCNKIFLIENKRIAEQGSHEELIIANGRYAKLFNTQSKYYKE